MLTDPERVLLQALDVVLAQNRDLQEQLRITQNNSSLQDEIKRLSQLSGRYMTDLNAANEEINRLRTELTKIPKKPEITMTMIRRAQNEFAKHGANSIDVMQAVLKAALEITE